MIGAAHDVFFGLVTHGALEKVKGFFFFGFEQDNVDLRMLEAVNFQGHFHFFAVFDAFGLLPGEGRAELGNAGALLQGNRRQTRIGIPVVNRYQGIDHHNQGRAMVDGHIDVVRPSNRPVDIMLVVYLKGPKEKGVGARSGDGPAYMQVAVRRGTENDSFQRIQIVGGDIQLGIDAVKVVMSPASRRALQI